MRNLTFPAVTTAIVLAAVPAAAQSWTAPSWQGSVGYGNVSADGTDVDLDTITGRVGARFNPYFGAEGELSLGLGEEQVIPGVDAELSYDAAAYAVGYLPVSPNLELFIRGGYGVTEMKVSGPGVTVTEDGDSWNYGVGAQYFFDGANGVRGDWTRRDFQDNGGEADVWTLSYVRRF